MTKSDLIDNISSKNWVKRWAGSYTFISASYWGKQYKTSLNRELGVGFDHSLFIHRKGTVAFYLLREELDYFGQTLAKQATENQSVALKWCEELKKNTDVISKIMKALYGKIISYEEYEDFLTAYDRHLPYHNAIKKTIDYFPAETLDKVLPSFKKARLYSEAVYSDTEAFFRSIVKAIAVKEDRSPEFLTCLTQEEFEKYIREAKLPKEDVLKKRYELSLLYFEDGEQTVEVDLDNNVEKYLFEKAIKGKREVKGVVAYEGVVSGKARIVPDPHKVKDFNDGDILITGMTRPEFLPLMEKASAIITDAGGILCHAAISARELKKPCIVGTQVATSIFHNEDMVKVDATKGIASIV